MTRQDFLDNVESFSDLLDFCYDNELYTMEDVISDLEECITEDLREYAGEYSWTDIRDWLNGIYANGEWYRRDGSFDYHCIDDYFEEWKSAVLEDADADGCFDDEEEDEETDQISGPDEEDFFSAPSDNWLPCADEIHDAAFRYREAAQRADAAIREINPANLYR